MKTELSVVIAYFRSNKIKKVIRNFLSMEAVKLEIFLINDHIDPIKKKTSFLKDRRVKYIQHKKNLGSLATFCEGLKMSKAKYIILSSDHDYFNQNSLKKLINPIKNNKNYIGAFSNFYEIDDKGKKLTNYKRSPDHFSYFNCSSNFLRALKYYLDPEYLGKANFFYSVFKRKFIDKKKFYNFHKKYGLNVDRIFIYDLIQKKKIYFVKDYHFNVIVHDKNYYGKRLEKKKQSKIYYFFLQILGYFENSRGLMLKLFIIILSPYKLYQLLIRRFVI